MVTLKQKPRVLRKDYKPPQFIIEEALLSFDLDFTNTRVRSVLKVVRRDEDATELVLNGEEVILNSIRMDGEHLERDKGFFTGKVEGEPDSITLPVGHADSFVLELDQLIKPSENTMLSGVYKSNEVLISFNEPHGMRRICYWIDRPDNMTKYTVEMTAQKATFPTLLSNGDLTKIEDLPGGYHKATYVDPWPKGPHLFAICAGKLEHISSVYKTVEGREVTLEVYSEPLYSAQLDWALEVTKQAFKFDEEAYGRAYDLDKFRVVGVSDFNMGAMENKSLCVFNISALVASPETNADWNFARVLTVIGHEYFHNWSGNRVNVRDWFQITLKEGFTRYREEEFEAWYYGRGVGRIGRVKAVRGRQFAEDAGPNAHPIRPESYVDVDNFYTATCYAKGAEVVGMYKALLGQEGYRKGTDYYFDKYDGQAVSCDEFRNSMAVANGRDLSQFELWYGQRRTPRIRVLHRSYDAASKTYTIKLKQILAEDADPEGGPPKAMLIPILMGLIGKSSKRDLIGTRCLELDTWEKEFTLQEIEEDCYPSILRDFSAPVILDRFLEEDELYALMAFDVDDFNRWEAGQTLMGEQILRLAKEEGATVDARLIKALGEVLSKASQDINSYGMIAECLKVPSATDLCNRYPGNNPSKIVAAGRALRKAVYKALKPQIETVYEKINREIQEDMAMGKKFDPTAPAVNRRSLAGVLVRLLSLTDDESELAKIVTKAYYETTTITEKEFAVVIAAGMKECEIRSQILKDHYELCKRNDENSLDAWFILQASASTPEVAKYIPRLAQHPDYKDSRNPNRVRALLGPSLNNYVALLDPSDEVLNYVVETLKTIDTYNPRLAATQAKLITAFSNFDEDTKSRLKTACTKLYDGGNCSFSLKEIVEPALT